MSTLESKQTVCDCGHVAIASGCTTGYGELNGKTYCFACCGERDQASMIETGKATLYLTGEGNGKVTNWPNTLSFTCHYQRKGNHNIAGKRYDVWFTGPDGKNWHGVQYGENTQICHCKRIKS